MKNENIYSGIGQALVMSVLVLLACSIYWTWNAFTQLARFVVDDPLSPVVALLGVVALVLIARRSVALAMLPFLLLAGIDRLSVSGGFSLLNGLLGWACLVFAAVIAVGLLSERLKWARDHFPSVLMVVLGVLFLAPVAVIGKILQAFRLLPRSADE